MDAIAKRAVNVAPSLTLAITAKGNKMKADGIDVVSFGAGEPDFNTPSYIIEKAKEALDKGVTKYTPSAGTVELRKAICDKLKKDNALSYEPSQIVVSNGAKHSLYNACLAIVEPGDEVLIPEPYWLTYPELVKLCDGVPKYISTSEKTGYKITPEILKNAITPKTKAIIFNNPSNPSGTVYSKEEITELAKVLEEADIYVISDEIYEKLTYETEPYSIAACSQKMYNNTIVVNGMSKTYSMTGWRIGYTASTKALATAMDNMQSHTTSNPNSIAQYATVYALKMEEGEIFLKEMKETFDRRRKLIIKMFSEIKELSIIEPKGAFYIMFGIEKLVGKSLDGIVIKSAADFANLLVDKVQVVAIPCESFGADYHIRLSYAVSDANIVKGIERIKKLISMLN